VTLNDLEQRILALILRYFTEFDSSVCRYVTVVEYRPIIAERRLPLLATNDPPAAWSLCDS